MNKILISALLVCGATMTAAPAMARVDVDVNLGFPGIYSQPAPVYVQPGPAYFRPAPVYIRPAPVYVQPAPVYYQPQRWERESWRHREWRGRRDLDHDGVPNYADRDRDGDGIPNRYDRYPGNPRRY